MTVVLFFVATLLLDCLVGHLDARIVPIDALFKTVPYATGLVFGFCIARACPEEEESE